MPINENGLGFYRSTMFHASLEEGGGGGLPERAFYKVKKYQTQEGDNKRSHPWDPR